MGIIITIVLGGIIGWLASIVTHRDAQQNWLENILVGIVGAFLGGAISQLFDHGTTAGGFGIGFDWADILWAFIGSVLLCLALNYFRGGRRTFRR